MSLKIFEEMASLHHWSYEMSEDSKVYNKGRDERRALVKIAKALPIKQVSRVACIYARIEFVEEFLHQIDVELKRVGK